ncbi:transglutaminase TgpA family protein [Roseimaritima sediminicola]|uniref:transglutaminase TgpA family protein n=1 Tax=Roseimaritima sediminicola TaxID=2662066 RepID=UPI001386D44B|nr:DUF3488 and transglutaminase-like domain-containing protein [Roseimaritima sediminicola]
MQRLEALLRIHFALLAALGGLILGFSDDSGSLSVIAVASALFAYVFVDTLRLISLPPVMAYIAMGAIAAYCISDFVPPSPASDRQLLAVAKLLVLVQAVLMLQTKTRRTFEQIGIFSLLEIVVAAVFNHTLSFAMLLLPIAALGVSAMVLLQAYSDAGPLLPAGRAVWRENGWWSGPARGKRNSAAWLEVQSPATIHSLSDVVSRLPLAAVFSFAPAALLVALVFFYALPRTTESDAMGLGGMAQVGFSDTVELNQVGRLQQNKSVVMRVKLRQADNGQAYHLSRPLYLRGKTLERYDFRGDSGRWQSSILWQGMDNRRLPRQFHPQRSTDQLFYDQVNVEIALQPLSTRTAFSIPPYHRIGETPGVRHSVDRWLLSRSGSALDAGQSRVTYRFGTHAFRNGMQTSLLRAFGTERIPRTVRWSEPSERWWRRTEQYRFESHRLPELGRSAEAVVTSMSADSQHPYAIAHRLNQFVASEAGLRYTLDLSFPHVEGMDPVEEFFTTNRAGHCQYFASALALMLRSQGIASRLVVGYKTSEYSPYGEHYVVRQSHAHVWVEALIEADQLPPEQLVYGQPDHGPIWLRLDPTPGINDNDQGQVTQAFDYAQGIWETWLVDMDQGQQQALWGESAADRPLSSMMDGAAQGLKWLAAGRLGEGALAGGALAGGNWFSVPAAAAGIGATVVLMLLLRIRLPGRWWTRRRRRADRTVGAEPQLDFFAELCRLLEPLGIRRRTSETPREFVEGAARRAAELGALDTAQPMHTLTQRYYAIRFGNHSPTTAERSDVRAALQRIRASIDHRGKSPERGGESSERGGESSASVIPSRTKPGSETTS